MNAIEANRCARIAGFLVLASIFAGGFAEVYVPGRLLAPSDPAATANNIFDSATLFRASFVVYLVEAICDITLALLFLSLLRPVSPHISMLAAFFGLVSTASFAVAELFYFTSSIPILDPDVRDHLTPDEVNIFVYVSLMLYQYGGSVFMVFYGIATFLRGYLVYRSSYFPNWLGVLMLIAGVGFAIKNVLVVLAPQFDSDLLLAPMFVAMICLACWLLVKGVDQRLWPPPSSADLVSPKIE